MRPDDNFFLTVLIVIKTWEESEKVTSKCLKNESKEMDCLTSRECPEKVPWTSPMDVLPLGSIDVPWTSSWKTLGYLLLPIKNKKRQVIQRLQLQKHSFRVKLSVFCYDVFVTTIFLFLIKHEHLENKR